MKTPGFEIAFTLEGEEWAKVQEAKQTFHTITKVGD